MRLHRTTKKGTRYAGTFEKAPSEGLLKALDAVVEAASEFMEKRWEEEDRAAAEREDGEAAEP